MQGHSFRQHEDRWACFVCFAQSASLPDPTKAQRCPGRCRIVDDLLDRPQGHHLFVSTFSDGRTGIVITCKSCGATTEGQRIRGLAGPCPKDFTSPHARGNSSRLSLGKHPNRRHGVGKILEPCIPLAVLQDAAVSSSG